MNYNGNNLSFQHLSNLLREPLRRDEFQAAHNAQRLKKIYAAISHQLTLIPLDLTLNAVGRIQAYNAKTDALPFDIIVIGYMSNRPHRSAIITKADTTKPNVYIGDAANLYLTLGEISGQPQNVGAVGKKGVFYLPNAKLFRKNERISLDVYKTEATPETERVQFVILAYRVHSKAIADALYNTALAKVDNGGDGVNDWLKMRESSDTVFLKSPVVFDQVPDVANPIGVAEVKTPPVDEPLIIRGCRSTLNNASIHFGIEGAHPFTLDYVPIWSIASGDSVDHENYIWFERGIYLPPKIQMPMKFRNDGIAFDDQSERLDADGTTVIKNTVTWICDTV